MVSEGPYRDFLSTSFSPCDRMENASEATAAVEGTKEEGVTLAAEVEDKGALVILQGDTEKEYYVSVLF